MTATHQAEWNENMKILVSLALCCSLLKWAYFKDLLCYLSAVKSQMKNYECIS